MTIGSGAVAAEKSLSPTVAPAVICRAARYRRKRWRMRRAGIWVGFSDDKDDHLVVTIFTMTG